MSVTDALSVYYNSKKEKTPLELEQEVRELTNRITKAIEYIKQEDWNTEYDYNLLNMLQNGSDPNDSN